MTQWKGKTRGNLLGYKIFYWLLQHAGLRAAYSLLRFVSLYFMLSPSATRPIYDFYHRGLGYSPLRALINTRKNFYVFGQTIIDKFAIMSGFRERFSYYFDGEEHLIHMANNTGGLLIGAHLGNWDIAGNFLNRLEKPFNIVMFEAEHENIKKFMDQGLKEKKVNVIAIKEDLSHVFLINKALANKELVCFHGDRFTPGQKTIEMDFLGRKALFPHGPFQIAIKFKVPYTFVYCMKEGNFRYHLFATPAEIHQGSLEELVALYIRQLEQKISHYPLQWFNYFYFWKTVS